MPRLFFLIPVVLTLSFATNDKKSADPDSVGQYAFSMLRGMDTLTDAEFAGMMMAPADIIEHLSISREYTLNEEYQYLMEEKFWVEAIEKNRQEFALEAEELGITWSTIVFESYRFRSEPDIYELDCFGVLKFKSAGKLFTVQLTVFFHNCGYHLVGLNFYFPE